MPIKKYIYLLFFFQLSANLFAQNPADSIYSSAEMVSDFNYLHKHLFLNHPGIYKYTNKETWDSVYQTTLKQLQQPLQDVKFRMVLRNYLSYSKCGHTQVIPSKKSTKNFEKRKHYTPPFKVAFINNKIIITENESNDSSLVKGTEILSLNGHSAEDIMMNIFAVQNADAGLQSMKNFYGAFQFPSF